MIQPYLMFEGRAEEAAEFYQRALGAKIEMLMRFKESPERDEQCAPPGADDKVMHMSLRIGDSVIMGSDGMCSGKPAFQGISLSIEARDVADAQRLFAALGDGGEVQMPMMKTFFSPAFGMVADRFGVSWMVVATPPAV
ncbi:MAG: VOC family protein [Burkholderiales bacterium]|nr:VOC family protein [Burkholderiales bacterium]